MRTTIRMRDRLLREAKKRASERGISLTAFIEEAVEQKIYAYGDRTRPEQEYVLPTFRGEGVYPHVDLDESASLLDALEG